MKSIGKLSREHFKLLHNPSNRLPALPVNFTVSPPEAPPASNRAGVRCTSVLLFAAGSYFPLSGKSLGSSPSARLESFNQGSGWSQFLRGLEEKNPTSPLFRILALKRLSASRTSPRHTARKPLSTETGTLHAPGGFVVKGFLFSPRKAPYSAMQNLYYQRFIRRSLLR